MPSGFWFSWELELKKGPSLSMLVFMPEMESLDWRLVADFVMLDHGCLRDSEDRAYLGHWD